MVAPVAPPDVHHPTSTTPSPPCIRQTFPPPCVGHAATRSMLTTPRLPCVFSLAPCRLLQHQGRQALQVDFHVEPFVLCFRAGSTRSRPTPSSRRAARSTRTWGMGTRSQPTTRCTRRTGRWTGWQRPCARPTPWRLTQRGRCCPGGRSLWVGPAIIRSRPTLRSRTTCRTKGLCRGLLRGWGGILQHQPRGPIILC